MKSMKIEEVRNFPFIEAPPPASINEALRCLVEHGALDTTSESITPLGQMLAQLPVEVAIG